MLRPRAWTLPVSVVRARPSHVLAQCPVMKAINDDLLQKRQALRCLGASTGRDSKAIRAIEADPGDAGAPLMGIVELPDPAAEADNDDANASALSDFGLGC